MKKLKKLISLVVCAIMLINFLPQIVLAVNNEDGTCTVSTGNIYVLTETLESGKNYLIVVGNSAGNFNTLSRNNNSVFTTSVTVKAPDASVSRPYIETRGNTTVWTANSGSIGNWTFYSDSRYLGISSNARNLAISTTATQFSISGSVLSWNNSARYARYNSGWTSTTSTFNATKVYFYEETSISNTYSLSASKVRLYIGDTLNVNDIVKQLKVNGNDLTTDLGGEYTCSIEPNNGPVSLTNNVLEGVNSGTAKLKVSYSWGNNKENTVWTEIDVTVSEPHYEVDIRDGETSKNIIPKKNVQENDTLQLNALVRRGNDDVPSPTIGWTSTNPDVATVDETGKVTFTGKEGTTVILATYTAGSVTVVDQVTVTASKETTIFPSDGTNDFPEYPDEGSVRLDKTGTAVGNFNQTGLVQVELSMTGVPYSKGVDVIVMLDMSSSMTRCIHCGKKRGESGGCSTFKSREQELSEAMEELQGVLQSSKNAANIRIAVADFNGTQSFGPTQYNANNHVDRTQDVGALTNPGNQKVYTGNNTSNSGTQVNDGNRRTLLSANAFIPVSQLDVSKFNYAPSTGTNYDYAFDAVYQLGHAIKQKNIADNDPNRELFVIFMSDGASNQFNYYNTTGGQSGTAGTSDWDVWLTGGIDGSANHTFSTIVECQNHIHYYDAATGNQHRMANAIKGNPNQKYEVIRKNQNLNQGQNSGGNDAVTGILESTGKDNLYWIPGLGATTYTIAFYVINDGNISGESAKHSLRGTASSANHYIEAEEEGAIGNAFKNIANQIVEAAKDVKVTDQITDDYTMVFEPPSDYIDGALGNNAEKRFYIDVLNYDLIPQYENGQIVDYNRSGTPTEVMKLYMGKNADGSYFAAKEDGSAYDAPQFAQTPLGTKYYWTTADIRSSESYSGVSVTSGGKTYYFDANGVYADSGADLSTWYNMVSGAYAHGTPETIEGSSDDKDATVYRDLVIATPYFVYNASTRQLLWTLDKLDNKEIALRYFLYLERAAVGTDEPLPGTYPTNVEATLSYTNFQNNQAQQWYPEPKMTWHGAQVTYVFYLVNDQGQPVNRAGRVIPFSEAVYVTDQHTISVVWTGLEKQKSLGANLLAQDIVPSVYQLYDTTAAYSVHAFENETEMKQHNHFRIDGATGTTYVFNSKSDATKYHTSGIYAERDRIMCKDYDGVTKNGSEWYYTGDGTQYLENGNPIYGTDDTGLYTIVYEDSDYLVEEGFNFYDTTVAFAVKWIPALAPDEVVIDYGLDVLVDITTNDLSVAEPIGLMAVAPSGVTENTGHILDLDRSNVFQSLEFKNGDQLLGKASLEGYNVRFHLDRSNGMQLTDDFTFYYVSEVSYYSENVLMKEYMYTHVRIIPATTMYYEEDYITTSTSGWSTVGSPSSSVQDVDRPGFNSISETNDANNVYGYDSHYTNCPNYSLNSTKLGEVGDKATFTFNGTGYDLIGRTDQQTACILVSMTQAGSTGNYTFTGTFVRDGEQVTATGDTIFVDTYYESNNGVAAIPQVPVITVRDLPYGTYTVTVEVVRTQETESDFYHESTDRFYFDALRIYDPINIRGYSDSVGAVYVMDNEWYPDIDGYSAYEEFRNEALRVYGDGAFSNSTFIDREGTISDIAMYNIWGPNNEFYLAPGESIRLNVDATYLKAAIGAANSRGMADMQLGIKLVSGGSSKVTISCPTNSRSYDITSTSDLNFSIKDMYNGTLVITNTGGGVVSLNTMKVTLLPPQTTATFALRRTADPGTSNQPAYLEEPTNQTTEMPASPNSVISNAILNFKETFAAVIIAVASAMDGFSKWLQDVANALFS